MKTKLIFENPNFHCDLKCCQCSFIKKDGQRCRNRVCFSLYYCWVHLPREYSIKIGKSTIPDAGKGLFSTNLIKANTFICPIDGQPINSRELNKRYGEHTAPYAIQKNSREYIDSACLRSVGASANTKHRANTVISRRRTGLWLKAIRRIHPTEEIFVNYGREYDLNDIEPYRYRRVKK